MSHYERVADVIRYLDRHFQEQPDLAELSERSGLSPHHFHRLFVEWAGVTPKDFLQCLTMEYARRRLLEGRSVLDAALDSGLSGPSRLHDLCVTLESATPGEIKSGGAGWEIRYGFAQSPFGPILIAESPRGICAVAFGKLVGGRGHLDTLRTDWPNAALLEDAVRAEELCEAIFRPAGARRVAPLKAIARGSAFQLKVWRALIRLPEGALASYGQIARALGKPGANRAVGSAIGCNPLAYLVPCHRVIRESGALGGYRWEIERKRAMIAREGVVGRGAGFVNSL